MKNITSSCQRHGLIKTRFYKTWCGIKARCLNPNEACFYRYGGRGINVCNEWLDFITFKNDMLESYKQHCNKFGEKNTFIERTNNSLGYSKENCKWATSKEQTRNRRSNHLISHNGKTKPMIEWAEEFGINYYILSKRIRRGWSIQKSLETPIMVNQFKFR